VQRRLFKKGREKKLISFGPIYTISFKDEARMHDFQERKEVRSG
jgi:hypothetical protein